MGSRSLPWKRRTSRTIIATFLLPAGRMPMASARSWTTREHAASTSTGLLSAGHRDYRSDGWTRMRMDMLSRGGNTRRGASRGPPLDHRSRGGAAGSAPATSGGRFCTDAGPAAVPHRTTIKEHGPSLPLADPRIPCLPAHGQPEARFFRNAASSRSVFWIWFTSHSPDERTVVSSTWMLHPCSENCWWSLLTCFLKCSCSAS